MNPTPGNVFDGERCGGCGSEEVMHPAFSLCEPCFLAELKRILSRIFL